MGHRWSDLAGLQVIQLVDNGLSDQQLHLGAGHPLSNVLKIIDSSGLPQFMKEYNLLLC